MRAVAVLAATGSLAVVLSRPHRVSVALPDAALITSSGIAFVVGTLAALALGLHGMVPVAVGVLTTTLPGARRHRSRERDLRREAARWPDFLAAVRSRLATGVAIPAACADAGRHIGGRFLLLTAPPGLPFADVIATARHEWSEPLADRILTTLEVANAVGGSHVGVVLGTLVASVNDDLRLRRTHDAALTEQRLTAAVALLAPWVILALSVATNPVSAEAFSTSTGNLIIGGGLAATVVGYILARRSARLSRPPRLFS
jgi:tight adherence protein B